MLMVGHLVGWLVGWLVSLFNSISTLMGYFMPKPSLRYYLIHSWGYKTHTFPKGISSTVNVIAWLKFEIAYYDFTVQHFSHLHYRNCPLPLYAGHSLKENI